MSADRTDEDPSTSIPETWKAPAQEAAPAVSASAPPTSVVQVYVDWSTIYLVSPTGDVGPFSAEQVYALYRAGQITLTQLLAPGKPAPGPTRPVLPLHEQLHNLREWAIPESGTEVALLIVGIGCLIAAIITGMANYWYPAAVIAIAGLQFILARNVIGFIRGRQ